MGWSNPILKNSNSRSLSSHYVFYKSLGNGENPKNQKIYDAVNSRLDVLKEQTQISNAGAFLQGLAIAEARKEKNALIDCFGLRDISFNPDLIFMERKKIGQILIDAYNTVLNYKQIYERNKAAMLNTKGKTIMGYFGNYFWNAWNGSGSPKMPISGKDLFEREVLKTDFRKIEDPTLKYNEAMTFAIERTVEHVLYYMFNMADDEQGSGEYKDSYKKFYREIMGTGKINALVQAIREDLFTNTIKERIQNETKQDNKKSKKNKIGSVLTKAKSTFSGNKGSLSGNIAEIIDMYITDTFTKSLSNDKNFTATHSGRSNKRPDVIYTYNIGDALSKVEKIAQEYANERSEAVEKFKELDKDFNEIRQGFILYVNQKEYLKTGIRFADGFSGGAATTVENFNTSLLTGLNGGQEFLGGLLQVAKGAIGEDDKDHFEDTLVSQIAYFLFDDYTRIGAVGGGAQAIHLMLLNGVYVPLSVIYMSLADAINTFNGDREKLKGLVSVNITAKDVLEGQPGITWEKQRDYALKNTYIKVNFLKNIQDMLGEYIG